MASLSAKLNFCRGRVSVSGNVEVSSSFELDLSGAELLILWQILPTVIGFSAKRGGYNSLWQLGGDTAIIVLCILLLSLLPSKDVALISIDAYLKKQKV